MRRIFNFAKLRTRVALGAAVLIIAVPLVAHSAELAMLDALAKGAWNLRIRDNGSQQRICVRSGRELIQIQHKQPGCSQFVVEDAANVVVVQYTCRGNGYGRTSIRREGSDVLQIQTQGIYDGTPFSYSGEARLSGSC